MPQLPGISDAADHDEPTCPMITEQTRPESPEPKDETSATCRICFLSHEETPELPPLISPCQCRGSMKYVHSSCAEQWRRASLTRRELFTCLHCNASYRFSFQSVWLFKLCGSVYLRSAIALLAYIGFVTLISHVVEEVLPPPNVPIQPFKVISWIPSIFSRVLQCAAHSFVWGTVPPEQDWKNLFRYGVGRIPQALSRRILVGGVVMGMFELYSISMLLKSRKFALFVPMHFLVSTFWVAQDGGRIDLMMKSWTMVFLAVGITRSIARFNVAALSIAGQLQVRSISEILDKDDTRAQPLVQ